MPYVVTVETQVELTDAASIYADLVTREVNMNYWHGLSLTQLTEALGLNDVHAAILFLMLANLRRPLPEETDQLEFEKVEEWLNDMSGMFTDYVEDALDKAHAEMKAEV